MFDKFKPESLKKLDDEIVRLTAKLNSMEPDSEDYKPILDNLRVLCDSRSNYDKSALSPDVVLGVAANLIGILIVLNFERTGTVLSKAFGLIGRKSS